MQRGAASLAGPVHIDRVEGLLSPFRHPRSSQRLPAILPRLVRRLDPSRVERQRRRRGILLPLAVALALAIALHSNDLGRVVRTALVRLVQANYLWPIEIGLADIATGLATVGVGDRVDVGPRVINLAERTDGVGQGDKRGVGRDDAVIGRAALVLNLLNEDQVRGAHVVDDVGGNLGQVSRVGCEVLNVVAANGEGLALPAAAEAGGRGGSRGRSGGFESCQWEDGVETEGLGDDACDGLQLIAHLVGVRVLGAVQGSANDDNFRVGV